MFTESHNVRALCKIQHHVAYDYDEKRGLWLYRLEHEEEVGNLITDAGRRTVHTFLYGTAAQRISASLGPDGLSYIGLSNDAGSPVAGDTTLAGELSGDGLDRTQGTVTLPLGAGTVTEVAKQFTYTGGPAQGVQKTALFDAASSGNMAHEILFTQRTLNTSDTITITFQITLA
jgi:hypothetical protein